MQDPSSNKRALSEVDTDGHKVTHPYFTSQEGTLAHTPKKIRKVRAIEGFPAHLSGSQLEAALAAQAAAASEAGQAPGDTLLQWGGKQKRKHTQPASAASPAAVPGMPDQALRASPQQLLTTYFNKASNPVDSSAVAVLAAHNPTSSASHATVSLPEMGSASGGGQHLDNNTDKSGAVSSPASRAVGVAPLSGPHSEGSGGRMTGANASRGERMGKDAGADAQEVPTAYGYHKADADVEQQFIEAAVSDAPPGRSCSTLR